MNRIQYQAQQVLAGEAFAAVELVDTLIPSHRRDQMVCDAVLVVVHTDRGDKTRLISARKANRRERQVFYDYLATTFEED